MCGQRGTEGQPRGPRGVGGATLRPRAGRWERRVRGGSGSLQQVRVAGGRREAERGRRRLQSRAAARGAAATPRQLATHQAVPQVHTGATRTGPRGPLVAA